MFVFRYLIILLTVLIINSCQKKFVLDVIPTFHDETISLNVAVDLDAVDVDNTSGLGLTAGGNVAFVTTDKGDSWSRISSNKFIGINDVLVFNADNCFIADSSGLYKSTDKGISWIKVADGNFKCLQFINENVGYAVIEDWIYKTTNGGNSFSSTASHWSFPKVRAMHFNDSQTGYAVGPDMGIVSTQDGGVDWKVESENSMGPDLFAVNANGRNRFVVGEEGFRNAGLMTFDQPASVKGWNLYGIDFYQNFGIVVGEKAVYSGVNNDNNQMWRFVCNSKGENFPYTFRDISLVNENLAFASGNNGILVRLTNLNFK